MFEIYQYGEATGIIAETYEEAVEYLTLKYGRIGLKPEWNGGNLYIDMPAFKGRYNESTCEIREVIKASEDIKTLKSPDQIYKKVRLFMNMIEDLDLLEYPLDKREIIRDVYSKAVIVAEYCKTSAIDREGCNTLYRALIDYISNK